VKRKDDTQKFKRDLDFESADRLSKKRFQIAFNLFLPQSDKNGQANVILHREK
jgi:hypothetical protein